MFGRKVEGAEEQAAVELRKLKGQFDQNLITADVYEAKRKPLLAIMIAGQDDEHVELRDGGGRRPLPRVHAMHTPPAPAPEALAPTPLNRAEGDKNKPPDGQMAMREYPRTHTDSFDLLGAETAVRHEFNPQERKWSRTALLCRIEPKPFSEVTRTHTHVCTCKYTTRHTSAHTHTHKHTHRRTHTHRDTNTHKHTQTHTHTHTHMHTHTNTHTFTHPHTHTHAPPSLTHAHNHTHKWNMICVYIHIYICIYKYTNIEIYICIYIYIYVYIC